MKVEEILWMPERSDQQTWGEMVKGKSWKGSFPSTRPGNEAHGSRGSKASGGEYIYLRRCLDVDDDMV